VRFVSIVVAGTVFALGLPQLARGDSLAITGLRSLGMSPEETVQLERKLRVAIAGKSPIQIANRAAPELQACTDAACVCRELDPSQTQWAVMATVGRLDRIYSLELTLIDVRTCRIESRSSLTEELNVLVDKLGNCAADLFGGMPREHERSHSAAYITLGSGAAVLAGAAAFALLARSARNELADLCLDDVNGRTCPGQARDALAADRRWSILTDLSVGVGLALVGTGLYLRLRNTGDAPETGREHAVVPVAGPGLGAGVLVRY
jgi:hypothetical protein